MPKETPSSTLENIGKRGKIQEDVDVEDQENGKDLKIQKKTLFKE